MAKYDQSRWLNIRLVLFGRYMTKAVSFLCTHLDWTSDNKFVGKRWKYYLHLAQSWWTWWKSVGSGPGYWFLIGNGNHKVNTLNRMGGRLSTRDTEETHTGEAENNQLIFEYWVNYSTTFVPISELGSSQFPWARPSDIQKGRPDKINQPENRSIKHNRACITQ